MHYDTNDDLKSNIGNFTDADVLTAATTYTAYIFSGSSISQRIDFQTLSFPANVTDWQVDEGVSSARSGFTMGSFPFYAAGTPSTGSPLQGRYEVHTQLGETLLLPHYTQQLITNGFRYTREDNAHYITCSIKAGCIATQGYAAQRSFTGIPDNKYRTGILAIQLLQEINLGANAIHDNNITDFREVFLLN